MVTRSKLERLPLNSRQWLCATARSGLRKPERELFAQVLKKRRHPAPQFREILAIEALEAHGLASPDQIFARTLRQDLDVAENVSARQIRVGNVLFAAPNRFHHAAVNDEKGVARIAGGIDRFARRQMPGFGKLTDCLQLKRLKRDAKAKKIPIDHPHSKAGVVLRETCKNAGK